MNRSRLRRMLCHLVLDWDTVQFDVSYCALYTLYLANGHQG